MYNTTANYKTYIKKPSREFECRVKIGSRTLSNSDIIQIVPEIVQPQDGFSIGNVVSQSLDITLKNDGGVYASVGTIEVEIGLKIENKIEYVPIGVFNIDEVEKTDYTVKVTAYDNMIKFETGYFSKYENPTLQQVVEELEEITGIEFTGTVPNYTVTKLQGYTCREVLAYVASICAGNAYITREGKFSIVYPTEVDCTITADNYIGSGYKIEDSTYKIGMITCQNKSSDDYTEDEDYDSANDKNTISVGALASDTMELTFENPWVTEDILNDIYGKLKDFSYLGYSMKWQGDLSLDPGDIVTIIDKNNIVRKAYIFANKLTYTGGLTAETSAKGETKNSNSFSNTGPSTQNIQRLSVKLLIAEQAIITKANIKDLKATNARIENLDVAIANIDTALINYAKVEQLDAVKANIATLNASVANIDSALINKANIADLNATNANISKLDATVADIKTLVSGNLTSANIQSLVLTSSKVTVDNGFIKNAMIESLDVTKINAGTLNTNKISVSSADGGLVIAGATQQFKDKNNKVRIQMGQDATGDFNFILRGEDGTTTLIDGTGVHEKAIADKLIKSNMVADSAIGEQQINYSSFVTGLNKDTNIEYIKASKVAIDLTGQSLDIAFNNMNTKVDGVQTTTNNNSTSIGTIQGQITTLISNTTITKDGKTTQLKDAYNGTVQTVNSLSTTIGEHTSTLNTLNGTVSSNSSKITSLQANLDTISASLSSTQSTVSTHTTQISTANTNITTALNNASSAITTANTAKTTATTASTDASNAKTTANTANTNASTALTNSNSAKTTANTANTNASSALSTANKASTDVATLTTTVTNTTSRVASLELTTSGLSTRIGATETTLTNLSIGGRNLWTTSNLVSGYTSTTVASLGSIVSASNVHKIVNSLIPTNGNKYVTIQIWNPNLVNNTSNTNRLAFFDNSDVFISQTTTIKPNGIKYQYQMIPIPNNTSTMRIGMICGATIYDSSINIKVEFGNQATDWTPAPEDIDSSIATVKDYATTTVNSAVSTINQTTDSIKANVSSLQSNVSTIQTTLGNKADATTVTAISNRTASLETSLTGINASITTLNSNVSSVTTTANLAKNAIDNLQVGGRNLLRGTKNFDINSNRINGWSTSEYTITKDENEDCYVAHCMSTGNTSDIWKGISSSLIPKDLIGTKKFTISMDLKIDSVSEWDRQYPFSLELYNSSKSRIGWTDIQLSNLTTSSTLTDGTWVTISFTYSLSNSYAWSSGTSITDVKYVGINLRLARNGSIYFKKCKLELGNKPTDWTPAPEDTDSQITTINSSVSSLQSSVSVLQNKIALKVEQTDINSAVSTIDGKITAQNATISSMQSSINLQLDSITSKVNKTVSTKNLANLKNKSGGEWTTTTSANSKSGVAIKFPVNNYTIVDSIGSLRLKQNTNYTLSFVAWTESRSQFFWVDLYPDTLPQTSFTVNMTPTRYTWTLNSSNADMANCSLRFFQTPNDGGITNVTWITDIQLEEGSVATEWAQAFSDNVGTVITQSTTEVMTAFNNISSYFQVSADGAKFGDISSGAYTKISTSGLEYVSSEGATPYHYVSYSANASVDMVGVTSKTVTINFPSNIVAMLNGKVPKATVNITSAFTMDDLYNWCSVRVDTIKSTSITVIVYFSSSTIVASTSSNGYFYTTNISTQKGGMKYNNIAFNYLIIG